MRERPFAEVLRRDAERIELPPAAKWVPAPRGRSGLRSLLAVAGAVVLLSAAATAGVALRRESQVGAPVAATTPPATASVAGRQVDPTANEARWAAGHMPTDTILSLLARAGLAAKVSPPAPAEMLLFNSKALELIAVEEPSLRGFVIYRYPDAGAARAAFQLPVVRDPTAGTIQWAARPRFVLMGDALVNYATNDDAMHERIARALIYPDVATIPPATCAEERERTTGMSAVVLRLDRVAAKKMTVAEMVAGGGPQVSRDADPDATVCVVALAGDLRQARGLQASPNYHWGVFVHGVSDRSIGATAMSGEGSWPAYFDQLPDRVPSPYVGTVVELVDPMALRVKLESAVLSQQFGGSVLLRADRYTELFPQASDLASAGIAAGDRLLIYLSPERRDAASGAYIPLKIAVAP